jgi:hypothetical protein
MGRSKLSEGWKIVISILFGFVAGIVMSSRYEPSLILIGALSVAMATWLIIQQF